MPRKRQERCHSFGRVMKVSWESLWKWLLSEEPDGQLISGGPEGELGLWQRLFRSPLPHTHFHVLFFPLSSSFQRSKRLVYNLQVCLLWADCSLCRGCRLRRVGWWPCFTVTKPSSRCSLCSPHVAASSDWWTWLWQGLVHLKANLDKDAVL